MNTPFKFRHLDAIVGGFVVGAVAVVIGSLLLVGHARQWFTSESDLKAESPTDPARADFLEELSEGLRPGTPVELGGANVGRVARAGIEHERLVLHLTVADAALRTLRADARAVIKVPLAPFMGQTRVLLKVGHAEESFRYKAENDFPAQTMPIEPPRDSTAMAMAVLKDLETNVGPLLANLNKTVQEVHGLLTEVRAQRLPEQAGQMAAAVAAQRFPERVGALLERADRMAAQVEGIIAGLAAGHGIAGKVLADDALAGDVAGMVADLKILTAELRRLAPQVPGLARQAGTTLDRADQVLDGVGRHWLLKDLVRPGDPAYATPSGVVAPVEAAP